LRRSADAVGRAQAEIETSAVAGLLAPLAPRHGR
jgi:hypothetical protein